MRTLAAVLYFAMAFLYLFRNPFILSELAVNKKSLLFCFVALLSVQEALAFRLGTRAEAIYEIPSELKIGDDKVKIDSGSSGLGYALMATMEPVGSASWGLNTNLGIRGSLLEWGKSVSEGDVSGSSKTTVHCPRLDGELGVTFRASQLSVPVLLGGGYPMGCRLDAKVKLTIAGQESKVDLTRELKGYSMRAGAGVAFEPGGANGNTSFGAIVSWEKKDLSFKEPDESERTKLLYTSTNVALFFELKFVNHKPPMPPKKKTLPAKKNTAPAKKPQQAPPAQQTPPPVE